MGDGGKAFVLRALLLARKYDVVHVHSLDKVVPLLKALYPRKRVVLHYHGTEIRGRWRGRERYWSKADLVLVSTPDLLEGAPSRAVYVPNPVDTELFRPLNVERKRAALLIVKFGRERVWHYLKPVADRLSARLGVPYEVRFADREPVSHGLMPLLLNRYEYYMDIPHGYRPGDATIPATSKTGLEALACGLTSRNA